MKIIKLILIYFFFLSFISLGFSAESLKLHFINVGEGDAILIQANNHNILIDTGNLLSGYKLRDYLAENKVTKIKYLILSHLDADHISGAFFLLPKLEIEQIYDNGQVLDENDDLQRWYKILLRSKKNYRRLKKGDRLRLENIELDVLWPITLNTGSSNENSLVIKLDYNNFSCLFVGDLIITSEEKLLQEKINLKSDILKVGHHGFSDATSQKFLEAISPKIAIISTDSEHKIGAPSPLILELLQKKNIKIYRTDKDGDIIVTINRKGQYSIKTSLH